jgi:hypothetical protein
MDFFVSALLYRGRRSAAAARRDLSNDKSSSQSNQRGFMSFKALTEGLRWERRFAVSGQTPNPHGVFACDAYVDFSERKKRISQIMNCCSKARMRIGRTAV